MSEEQILGIISVCMGLLAIPAAYVADFLLWRGYDKRNGTDYRWQAFNRLRGKE